MDEIGAFVSTTVVATLATTVVMEAGEAAPIASVADFSGQLDDSPLGKPGTAVDAAAAASSFTVSFCFFAIWVPRHIHTHTH